MPSRELGMNSLLVLSAIARGHRYGFDVMDATGLESGAVYRALSRLMDLRFVDSRWESAQTALREKRPRRRYYEITDAGRRELAAARDRFRTFAKLAFGEGLLSKAER